MAELARIWRKENATHFAELNRVWTKANPGKSRALHSKYRAKKLNATVAWADDGKIFAVYFEARLVSELTGIKHAVDHVVPLQGRLVSGLHVEHNLRIVEASENSRKSNKWEP